VFFFLFVNLALDVIAIRAVSSSLYGRVSHGFVVVMVPLISGRCYQIAISHVFL
jgi:hypothetical protein